MSKCREEFEKEFPTKAIPSMTWDIWQDAWNARGKVDAEICNYMAHCSTEPMKYMECAQAIEQENEK